MIQNPSGFTLDLDIIAYIFPMENGSLLLEDGGYIDVGRSLLDTRTLDLSELFVATASLGEDSWLVATTEEEDFTLGFLGGDVFSCDEVDGAETDHEDPEDTEVSTTVSRVPIWDDVSDLPPLVGCIVLVGLFNISSTFNNSQAWDSTNSRADSLQRRHILVPRSTWDERCRETGIVLADELIEELGACVPVGDVARGEDLVGQFGAGFESKFFREDERIIAVEENSCNFLRVFVSNHLVIFRRMEDRGEAELHTFVIFVYEMV